MTDTPLTAEMIHPLPLAMADGAPIESEAENIVSAPWLTLADLRFFVTCYLVGLVFFLVMLS